MTFSRQKWVPSLTNNGRTFSCDVSWTQFRRNGASIKLEEKNSENGWRSKATEVSQACTSPVRLGLPDRWWMLFLLILCRYTFRINQWRWKNWMGSSLRHDTQKSNFESRPVGHVMLFQTLIEVVFQNLPKVKSWRLKRQCGSRCFQQVFRLEHFQENDLAKHMHHLSQSSVVFMSFIAFCPSFDWEPEHAKASATWAVRDAQSQCNLYQHANGGRLGKDWWSVYCMLWWYVLVSYYYAITCWWILRRFEKALLRGRARMEILEHCHWTVAVPLESVKEKVATEQPQSVKEQMPLNSGKCSEQMIHLQYWVRGIIQYMLK